jgi:hypothetical protein
LFLAFRNLILPAALMAGTIASADATRAWENTTARPFRIQFQKDGDTNGTLTIQDGAFTLATWGKDTPDGRTLEWPALRTFKLTYSAGLRTNARFRIRVLDEQNRWVQFLLKNFLVGDPTITQEGASSDVVEAEGAGFKTKGLGGGFKLNNKGFWSVKHDGTNY